MQRIFVCAVAALFLVVGGLRAGEYKGMIKNIDIGKHMLTITTSDGKDHCVNVVKDTKFLTSSGKPLTAALNDKHFKKGVNVVAKFDMKQGKEAYTCVQLVQAPKPRK